MCSACKINKKIHPVNKKYVILTFTKLIFKI